MVCDFRVNLKSVSGRMSQVLNSVGVYIGHRSQKMRRWCPLAKLELVLKYGKTSDITNRNRTADLLIPIVYIRVRRITTVPSGLLTVKKIGIDHYEFLHKGAVKIELFTTSAVRRFFRFRGRLARSFETLR